MTLNEFVNNYNNTKVGTGQCVALIKQYESDVLGLVPESIGNAHQYYDDYETIPFLYENFNRYSINSGLPQIGDIIVWNTNVGGGYGHIAIVTENITETEFTSFDQNWNTPLKCNIETHNYNNVLGYLRIKSGPGPGPGPGPTPIPTIKKNKFKWVLYSNKLRNKRKER